MTALLILLALLGPPALAWILRSLFSRRLLATAGAGVPLLLAGAWRGWSLTHLVAAYDGLLIAAYLLDYLASAGPRQFMLTRRVDEVLSLGATNPVRVEIEYRGAHRTRVAVRDEPPPEFTVTRPAMTAVLRPGTAATVSYAVLPPRRGLFRFGRLHLRYRGRFGLVVREARIEMDWSNRVHLSWLALDTEDGMAALEHGYGSADRGLARAINEWLARTR